MPKPESVNYYRHRKNKHRQVITYEQPDGTLQIKVIDWERAKVTRFEEENKEGAEGKSPTP